MIDIKTGNRQATNTEIRKYLDHGINQCRVKITRQGGGMTLRDYFAAKAMQGLIANSGDRLIIGIANTAYEIADAMISTRGE